MYEVKGPLTTVIEAKDRNIEFDMFRFEFPNGLAGKLDEIPEAVVDELNTRGFLHKLYSVLQLGEIRPKDSPLVRVHSACFHGDTLRHRLCDCGEQYEEALDQIAAEGKGLLIYCQDHEGRGIGVRRHFDAYMMQQEKGVDTFDSFRELGLEVDPRSYSDVVEILRDYYGLRAIRLLTNNPDKIQRLEEGGIKVARVPLWVPRTKVNAKQIDAKIANGHLH